MAKTSVASVLAKFAQVKGQVDETKKAVANLIKGESAESKKAILELLGLDEKFVSDEKPKAKRTTSKPKELTEEQKKLVLEKAPEWLKGSTEKKPKKASELAKELKLKSSLVHDVLNSKEGEKLGIRPVKAKGAYKQFYFEK